MCTGDEEEKDSEVASASSTFYIMYMCGEYILVKVLYDRARLCLCTVVGTSGGVSNISNIKTVTIARASQTDIRVYYKYTEEVKIALYRSKREREREKERQRTVLDEFLR